MGITPQENLTNGGNLAHLNLYYIYPNCHNGCRGVHVQSCRSISGALHVRTLPRRIHLLRRLKHDRRRFHRPGSVWQEYPLVEILYAQRRILSHDTHNVHGIPWRGRGRKSESADDHDPSPRLRRLGHLAVVQASGMP